MTQYFDWGRIDKRDRECASFVLGGSLRQPDVFIRGENPHMCRWFVKPRSQLGNNTYLHIQIADDPHVMHDHPWHSMSVVLAGRYSEMIVLKNSGSVVSINRLPGDIIFRDAYTVHKIRLPVGCHYSMSLFMTGPKVREWGFRTRDGWEHHDIFHEKLERMKNEG